MHRIPTKFLPFTSCHGSRHGKHLASKGDDPNETLYPQMFKLFRLGHYCNCCKIDPDVFIGLNWKIMTKTDELYFSVSLSHNFWILNLLNKTSFFPYWSLPIESHFFLNQTDEISQLLQHCSTSALSAQEEVLQRPIVYEGSTVPIPRVKAWTPIRCAIRCGGRKKHRSG